MVKIIENRLFKIWAYSISHKVLIMRSEMQLPDLDYDKEYIPNRTIDIEFEDVQKIDSDTEFVLQKISAVKGVESTEYDISHSSGNSKIIAGNCKIGISEWITESRATDPFLEYSEEIQFD